MSGGDGMNFALEYLLPGTCEACGHVLLCQAINDIASQDPNA
jgi:hypothetical protein